MGNRSDAVEGTRTRIREALQRLLLAKAYGAITIADIAGEADVSVRTVQRHFRSKDDALASACRHSVEWIAEAVSKRPAAKRVEEAIRYLVEAQFEVYSQHDAECWAGYSRTRDVPELEEAARAASEGWAAPIEGLISSWPNAWAVEAEPAKRLLQAMLSYPAWRAFREFGGFTSPEAARLVTRLLWRSLLRGHGSGRI